MKILYIAILISSIPFTANAGCISQSLGETIYSTCDDGSSYVVNQFGDASTMQGYNSITGNSWYSSTQRIGDSSTTYGSDADGNTWNATTIQSGNMTTIYGTDSDGEAFSTTCNQVGNQTYCY